jgi:dTDP-4-amino-4,6-dideoxygalactose transaminase
VVRTRKRADFRKHLGNHGVASEIHYPVPDHRQPVFKGRFDTQVLRNTEQLADEIVTLPLYPEMTDQDVARVIEVVNAW